MNRRNYNKIQIRVVAALISVLAISLVSFSQYTKSTLTPPPPPPVPDTNVRGGDSVQLQSPVRPTVSIGLEDYEGKEYPTDLKNPKNITTEAVYDPESGMYVIHTKLGEKDIITPFMMTAEEYHDKLNREEMYDYFRSQNSANFEQKGKEAFNILDMNFALGPLEKVFGPGGVRLTTQGSVQLSAGIKSNKTDNPSLSLKSRRKTYFDFNQKIQATINASVGDKMKFNMNYNTDATFSFDSQKLKLQYEGKEDEIIKNLEAGNVSMTTGSSLIRGGTALFGAKAKLQFGKLTLTGLISQQNSESKSISTKGGVQSTEYEISAADYDANRHFFLSQYFYQHYDDFCAKLPYVASGINITRIEVWITNKTQKFDESRNFVAFMDLGENTRLGNDYWVPDLSIPVPSNQSNNLLSILKSQYPDARNINQVTEVLKPLNAYGIEGGKDFEKVESARLLNNSEYTLNAALGYISLKQALNTDEVLAVAFEYTYNGKVYQVGEFSGDITSTESALYLKMLRGTTVTPKLPMWQLMMKNIYSLGAYQIQKNNFKMNIKFLSDSTGIEIPYLPVAPISNKPLLQVMGLDRIDSNGESVSDGIFDFIEGYTIQTANGKIIFPVAEPFGSNLRKAINNDVLSEPYVYQELYDSTLVVAKQFADKNKFTLTGEYSSGRGSQINLGAMNVPRGSVVVTAGGAVLTENSDYTVDYSMGIVTITNQSIIESGTNVSVTLENQSMFSMQRKTLMGLDAQYKFNKDLTLGGTFLHFGEKSLTEKVGIGEEIINNTMFGFNLNYNKQFMWLTDLMNKVPTINATAPSSFSLQAEYAQLIPAKQKTGTNQGSSYVDDFETTQTGVDLRNPYSWFLASTPQDNSSDALFPEASLSNNPDYGKNRALLAWNYIDRIFTQKNSSMLPGYLKNDLKQLSNPYVREIQVREIYPGRETSYGDANYIQTLNLSFYPKERGPYNVDADNIDSEGYLLNPEKRWGGIMRKIENSNFETSNVEYIQFWLLDPFLDKDAPANPGGDLYFNFGEISEDILKDGMKSYENGLPVDGNDQFIEETVWGKVSKQNSLTYAFENTPDARLLQDVGLDGIPTEEEFSFSTYADFVEKLRNKLPSETIAKMQEDPLSVMNDPAQDNYHFFRSDYYDAQHTSILDRYKHYNGVEGNSLSPDQSDNPQYQSSRAVPDVEDINQDNTLNEYERYFQYKVSIRPEDLEVGKNFVTDKQVTLVPTRDGSQEAVWYQFKIPLTSPEKVVGGISDFSTIRFARMFMTGFSEVTHLRFGSLELVRGEWRDYKFNLNSRNDSPAEGELDMSVVNIEENSKRTPVNYVLPPGVSRIQDASAATATQLNEQALQLKLTGVQPGDARGIYKNTQMDLRIYKRLQMWVHAEADVDDRTNLKNGDLAIFVRVGSDVKNNYYEYEIPLDITAPGVYNNMSSAARWQVWPQNNFLDLPFELFTDAKVERNKMMSEGRDGVGYRYLYSMRDPNNQRNTVSVMGNPSLSDVRTMLIGVRNKSNSVKNGTIWVNELKVTEFNQDGGWAAKVNANLAISDIATVNFAMHKETAGFGGVDQGLSARRLDNYDQYNIAVQGDLGKLVPEKVKLSAPIYYSRSNETTTPKYNPLDQDILLKDALAAATTKAEKDSIKGYAETKKVTESFALSNMRFNVTSKNAMPWDPASFTVAFNFNKQRNNDPTTEYENTSDYRGSFQYSYSPYFKPWKPFSKLNGKSKFHKFLKEWQINWLFNNLTFFTSMSRHYYEQQIRSEADAGMQLPVQVSKNFLWDRQLSLNWNLLQSLTFSFESNTTARIEETIGAVNKKLFPDKYRDWKDTVLNSIKGLGTPWNYNQTFTGSYKAPFNKIPFLDYLTANVSYSSNYQWDRGVQVQDVDMGNTIRNQSTWNADAKFNFETLYNHSKYLKEINQRFSARGGGANARNQNNKKGLNTGKKKASDKEKKPAKKVEKSLQLSADSTTVFVHNLKTKNVALTAKLKDKPFKLRTKVLDENRIEILTKLNEIVDVTVREIKEEKKTDWGKEILQHSLRLLMAPRNFSFRWRQNHSLDLPLFAPSVGDVFGQSQKYGPMAPGLDFAFGFYDESYVDKALERGWLLTDGMNSSPAVWNQGQEFHFELTLEPIRGLKITLTDNLTDNRTNQVQFMYSGMPTSRTGNYTRTHVAIKTALKSSNAADGYNSEAFNKFLEYIPVIANRYEDQYKNMYYPKTGFMDGNPLGGTQYNPEVGSVSRTSSDVLIPAFLAAYSGSDPKKVTLSLFPGLSSMLPNWKVTYDGFINLGNMKKWFKSFTVNHAYNCTYSTGGYTSYLNWIGVDGDYGFTLDEATQSPIPSSPYNVSSVAITERFNPLIGFSATLNNDLKLNMQYVDSRTLNLNSQAGQVVETSSRQITIGAGYKIANFNKIIKIGSRQGGVSNDLSLDLDINFANNSSLIRKIETAFTQATQGTKSFSVNFMASYVLSRRITLSAFFDHQVNTPLVSSSAFPTSNSNFGVSINMSLAR
ncbi:MAG: cell surface protein SprA [Muribaculum sp.]|nr:cell surface protein SprA [Muribaculum sp.]